MLLILTLLTLVALYCGGMWLWRSYNALTEADPAVLTWIEKHTFHLGLCFILAIGFLGLILAIQGS